MQLAIPDSISGNSLRLGIQTHPGQVAAAILHKIKAWAPGRAKSYRLLSQQHTDYHGRPVDHETGYATIEVAYFSTLREGTPLPAEDVHTLWQRITE